MRLNSPLSLLQAWPREIKAAAMGKSTLRQIASLGHASLLFLAARRTLLNRTLKQPGSPLHRWLQDAPENPSPPPASDYSFATLLSAGEKGLEIQQWFLDVSETTRLLDLAKMHGKGPADLPAAVAMPVDAGASIWPALIRLPMLLDFWEQELRRNHHQLLLDCLPQAWVLDPEPVPPGAVIAGLECSSWQEASGQMDRHHAVSPAWQAAPCTDESTAPDLATALSAYPYPVSVLTRRSPATGGHILALYHTSGSRTGLSVAFVLQTDDSGQLNITAATA